MFEKLKSFSSKTRDALNRKIVGVQSYIAAEAPALMTSKAGNRFLGACLAATAAIRPAFAANSNGVVTGLQTAMNNVYGTMKSIGIIVGAGGIALSAFYLFTGGDKGMEKAKKTILYTIIGCGILFLAVPIMNVISGMFSSSGSDFNGLTDVK